MQFYHTTFAGKDTVHPQFEVRNNKVYATIYNKDAGEKRSLPWYEIKGNNIHTTAYNPQGHDIRPMYEIRGSEVHTTPHNPNYSHTPVFNIRK
jgi:hypothetical protein